MIETARVYPTDTDSAVIGFDTFLPFKQDTFVTSYIGIPVFGLLWAGYKVWYRTKLSNPEDVDLVSGKREIDEEEQAFLQSEEEKGPRTIWQKLWDSL